MAFFRRRREADSSPPADLAVPLRTDGVATYLVATQEPPDDPMAEAHAGSYTGVEFVPAMLEADLVRLSVHRVDDPEAPAIPPADLLGTFGPPPALLARYDEAVAVIAVQSDGLPGWPPLHEWAARAIAGQLAINGEPIVDLALPQLIDSAEALAALPTDETPFVVQRWIKIVNSPGPSGHWITTSGLVRFGLPEIQVRDVPPHLPGPVAHVLNGIAHVLLSLLFRSDDDRVTHLTIPRATLEVSLRDISIAMHGSAPEADADTPSVTICFALEDGHEDGDRFLTVLSPPEVSALHGVFLDSVCAELFGVTDHEIAEPADQDQMDRLIAQAREELAGVRARYLEGLPPGHELLVKWKLVLDDGSEYPWAFVTDWSAPGQLTATSASDAHGDPSVRAGVLITLPCDDLVDWAIWQGGEIIEGNKTSQAL